MLQTQIRWIVGSFAVALGCLLTGILPWYVCILIVGAGFIAAAVTFRLPTLVRRIRPYRDDVKAPARVHRVYAHWRAATGLPVIGPVCALCRVELLAGPCWALYHETLLAHTHSDRKAKEVVAEAVSRANACTFSQDLHASCVGLAPTPEVDGVDAHTVVPDLKALENWALGTTRAAVRAGEPPLTEAPFTQAQAPELVGTVVLMNFVNRMADIFVEDMPAKTTPAPFRNLVHKATDRLLAAGLRFPNRPGAAFHALAPSDPVYGSSNNPLERVEEELPSSLRRVVSSHANVLLALEIWSRACMRDARSVLRKESRDIVRTFVASWDGEQRLGTAWATELAASTPHELDRPLLRIALLSIVGPFQLGDEVDDAVTSRGEEAVVLTAAFGACHAARTIGERVASQLA